MQLSPHRAGGYVVTVSAGERVGDFLYLGYEVAPAPPAMSETSVYERDDVSAADDRGNRYIDCHGTYRRTADGSRVVGCLVIGPVTRSDTRWVAIRFAPLAQTPAVDDVFCDVGLELHEDRVTATSVRLV